MTVEMGEAFEAAVGELREMPPNELRAAILTGAGRAFSAGGDLDWLLERHRDSPTNNAKIMRDFYGRFLSLRTLEVGITFVGLGLPPGMGSTHWLPSIVGPQRANELILTGEVVDGAEAARRGLVLRAAEDPVAEANELAATIAAQAPLAVRAAVRAARLVQEAPRLRRRRTARPRPAVRGPRGGVAALKERRAPAFAGV
ncbi:enoyl-CoA hydratase [Aureococcus anophagefferens]|nr:enoyl-CoA hydratase [Aureococcus anophagefferens]